MLILKMLNKIKGDSMGADIFSAYSAYYDLLYKDKPYVKEVDFIDELLRERGVRGASIVDLGCGTGIHAWLLAERGHRVIGIDQSTSMIDMALGRAGLHSSNLCPPQFRKGTLESFNVDEPVDAIVSLFDVVSYIRDYQGLALFASNVKRALKPGGMLLFDCWYGPAVYTQRPGPRVRKLENEQISLLRVVDSVVNPSSNHIDVHYDIVVTRKSDGSVALIAEDHRMRCYFEEELNLIMEQNGLKPMFCFQWFSRERPSLDSWSVLFGFQREN